MRDLYFELLFPPFAWWLMTIAAIYIAFKILDR